MNKRNSDILNTLLSEPYINQRLLSESSGHSLGAVNQAVKELENEGYIDGSMTPTEKARRESEKNSPRSAVILAAGYGMRMVPINKETPKGLLDVYGEPLIERLIKQLHKVGIYDISVIVGFMKEQFEYLIDEYGVDLVVNPDYSGKNNLHSLKLVADRISNTYIIPCDIWCKNDPFSKNELYSWYMVRDSADEESDVRVSRKMELIRDRQKKGCSSMVGISYITEEDAAVLKRNIADMCSDSENDDSFWEEALYTKKNGKEIMTVCAKVVPADEIIEINTYEQLRELDSGSHMLRSDVISVISDTLNAQPTDIVNITVLKKGMTNRSFLFECLGKKYIMRIPGEGTDKLINRAEEAAVYRTINGLGICDNIAYINPQNGYKITEYMDGARVCDPLDGDDLEKCMKKLRSFHELGLTVPHEFDIFRLIDFYEELWEGTPSAYRDYEKTKEKVFSLKKYIDSHASERSLTHIDAVPDNFLFVGGQDEPRLIDWEYAGMQDPHVDIAMFSIYALYNRQQIDRLIDIYFEGSCPHDTRIKIYCYVAACGLLWSNWCEYKRCLGVEFGEYSLRQYRFAKDYYRIASEEMKKGAI